MPHSNRNASCQDAVISDSKYLQMKLPNQDLLARRFHVIMGKGGVGKSTVAMALGLSFAKQGLKTLICEVDDREMMSHAFEVAPSYSEVRELQDNLYAVCIDTQSALSEYGALKLKLKALSKLLTENPLTRALISIVPGVADLIALGKAFNHERERNQSSHTYKWDRIIVDAPSTGHGLTFLKLPLVIQDVVPSGNMRKEADEMWALLSNAKRCCIHVVSTTEEMPIQESKELWKALDMLGLSAQALWLNKVVYSEHSPVSLALILKRLEQSQQLQNQLWLSHLLEQKNAVYEEQLKQIAKLEIINGERAFLPYFPTQTPTKLRESISYALDALDQQKGEAHV